MPFSQKIPEKDGVELPVDVWPATGSFGFVLQLLVKKEIPLHGIRYFLTGRFENNFENTWKYKFGNSWYVSFFVSKHLYFPWTEDKSRWTAILQLRTEIREQNKYDNKTVSASGGYMFYISPQINFTLIESFNISVLFDYPFYQYYNETQLGNSFATAVNLTWDLNFKRKNNLLSNN